VERGADIVARGLSTLDELESAEWEESAAVLNVHLNGAANVADWGAVLGAIPSLRQ
jgi:hypothetical protein